MLLNCKCFIIPKDVLERFAHDASLPAQSRKAFSDTSSLEDSWRKLRSAHTVATLARSAGARSAGMTAALAAAPAILVYNCNHTTSLPGTPVANPGSSADATAKRAYDLTKSVAEFYKTNFGRNSIDNNGMTLQSSVHYGVNYNNAFWDGSQMTYGDGDNNIFIDFTASSDVVGHELTHGVTQFTAGLNYTNEAGGLNESISDVFGTMFRQWLKGQDFGQADWLIGSEIMGPAARQRGFTCLRDMASPGSTHCLAPQPSHYSQYVPGSDPHSSSGIPNYAFYLAAKALGGKSWEKLGKVWYAALNTPRPARSMGFRTFAKRTKTAARQLYPADPAVYAAVLSGWTGVGL